MTHRPWEEGSPSYTFWYRHLPGLLMPSSSLCTAELRSAPSFCSHPFSFWCYIRQYSSALHRVFMANFFKSGWSGPSSYSVLVWKLHWKLSTMGDPAGVWNTGGIAFSITATQTATAVWQPTDGWCGSLTRKQPRLWPWEHQILSTRPPQLAEGQCFTWCCVKKLFFFCWER